MFATPIHAYYYVADEEDFKSYVDLNSGLIKIRVSKNPGLWGVYEGLILTAPTTEVIMW